jgi:AbrB family looped-hinge helix DNA binding protein
MNILRGTFTSKGQLVIPSELRKKHNIRAGTKVAIFEDPSGRIILQPITEEFIDRMTGCLKGGNMVESWLKEHRIEGERGK